ncbi:MAG TPA: hypothetical protein VFS21_00945 [Roseiflexaceae bacterium]|nr:hypothetical protein [Roseiflexaceae bacterium]
MADHPNRLIFNLSTPPGFEEGTVYLYSSEPAVQLDAEGPAVERNATQQERLRNKPFMLADGSVFGASLGWAYRSYIVHRLWDEGTPPEDEDDAPQGRQRKLPLGVAPARPLVAAERWPKGERVPTDGRDQQLILFNVLVALEWLPDERYMNQLEWSFRRASDFLYDVTDGAMAFGQVVFGGRELMGYADVQIMASSRLHPRSWVSGLHVAEKYTPIRMGRGLWHRRNRFVIPWDEPEGYRTFVHEWAHYALGLRDQYLREEAGLVVPDGTIASSSIMATLEGTSELVAHQCGDHPQRRSAEWDRIRAHFKGLERPAQLPYSGPGRLPLPLPAFARVGDLAKAARPRRAPRALDFPADLSPQHCWVYVLRGCLPGSLDAPTADGKIRLIAQGTLDTFAHDDQRFELLGARPDDTVLLMHEPRNGRLAVFRGVIGADRRVDRWTAVDVARQPVISVLPVLDRPRTDENAEQHGPETISVRVHIRMSDPQRPPKQVWLATLGQQCPSAVQAQRLDPARAETLGFAADDWVSELVRLPSLDGHVLAFVEGGVMIHTFSQGGGPPSHGGVDANPVTAGSSDGNIMLFFRDDGWKEGDPGNHDYSDVKVITTLCLGAKYAPPSKAGPAPMQSYLYTIASTKPLPEELRPTLVMFYDPEVVPEDGEPQIYRLREDSGWEDIETYSSPNNSYVAIQLSHRTAGRLFKDKGLRSESYRIYWNKKEGKGKK